VAHTRKCNSGGTFQEARSHILAGAFIVFFHNSMPKVAQERKHLYLRQRTSNGIVILAKLLSG